LDGRKTAFLAAGEVPQSPRVGEKYALLPAQPVLVSTERDGRQWSLEIVAEPDDTLAATLEKHPAFDDDWLATLCDNALAAALSTVFDAASSERIRAFVSVELMLSGFRCVGLSCVSQTPPAASAQEKPPEPSGSTAELAEELRKVSEMAAQFEVSLPNTAMPAGETLEDRERIIARLKATGAELSARLREFRENLADSRAIEMRLGLPEAPEQTTVAKQTSNKKPNVEVPNPTRPFTMLVWRRTDIDDKLRRYVDKVLVVSAEAVRKYRHEALIRHFKLSGRADLLATSLDDCRAELSSWPVLRHGFSYTWPTDANVRLRIKKIKAVADAAAGARNAVAVLCRQPLDEKIITESLGEAEAAVKSLSTAMRS
jgi:hypothetical protein